MHDRRDDVQGLRAIAVSLVVVYHLWPSSLPGGFVGVDVFFVISGFLITRNLLASPPNGRSDVIAFWGRRIRRLLPAGFLVLATTLFASHWFAPETEWVRTAKEAVASAFYVENWLLVQQATDYLAPTSDPTPVQHYWSLSVEEQFYVVWPVLLIGAVMLAGQRQARSVARWLIAVVLGVSLWHSITATAADPDAAYFLTTTRIWELAAGGLLATWIPPVRLPFTRAVGSWLGLGLIAGAALGFSDSTPWPGSAALVPVLGAVLFIWSASGARLGPGLVLGHPWAQGLGDMSYSVYLWHWPIIVLAPTALGRDLTHVDRLGVIVLTLVLSWLTFAFVENRWRVPDPATPNRRPFQLAVVGAAFVSLVAGAQVVGMQRTDQAIASTAGSSQVEAETCFGGAALVRGEAECPPDPDGAVVPAPAAAVNDRAAAFTDGCLLRPPYAEVKTCTFGTGSTQVALVGNSHAAHWLPALQEIADQQDLTITTYLITACSTVDAPLVWKKPGLADACERWRDQVQAETKGDRFDLVITSQRSVYPVAGHTLETTYQPWVDGMRSFLRGWTQAATPVLVIRDTPYPGRGVPRCVAEHTNDQDTCSGPRSAWELPDPLAEAADGLPGVAVVDLNDHLCTTSTCEGVVGGVIAYFDNSHLTATFARTMAPYIAPKVSDALDYSRSTISISSGLD